MFFLKGSRYNLSVQFFSLGSTYNFKSRFLYQKHSHFQPSLMEKKSACGDISAKYYLIALFLGTFNINALLQRCPILLLEGQPPAEYSFDTLAWKFLVRVKN